MGYPSDRSSHAVPAPQPTLIGIVRERLRLIAIAGPSSSGKTVIIASTEGNFRLPEREEVVGLNVYRKK